MIGTAGKIVVPDPWLCRLGHLVLERDGVAERLPVDPDGRYNLGDPTDPDNDDAYRIEFENASRVISGGAAPVFDQAAAIRGRPRGRRHRHRRHSARPYHLWTSPMNAPLRVGRPHPHRSLRWKSACSPTACPR